MLVLLRQNLFYDWSDTMQFVCPLIVVKDIDKSRNFYENILNQKVKYDFGENIEFEGGFSIHLESHFKKLIGNQDVIKKTNNFELYFEEENLDRIFNTLKENGIEFIHEITEHPWGQRAMRFYDFDFHIIEIGESMQSVVIRLYNNGMTIEEINSKTSMPIDFIKKTVSNELI